VPISAEPTREESQQGTSFCTSSQERLRQPSFRHRTGAQAY
jgi:hypothetical protein